MSGEFVYVPVPTHWVGAIYRRLAELELAETGAGTAQPESAEPPPLTHDLVERMWQESEPPVKAFMWQLASHPNQWFTTTDLAEILKHEKGARGISGMLGAFGRRSKNRYGHAKPWETEWDNAREQAHHLMSPQVAAMVMQAAEREREAFEKRAAENPFR